MINLKDILRNDKPEEEAQEPASVAENTGSARTGGDELVPDFASATDYIADVE